MNEEEEKRDEIFEKDEFYRVETRKKELEVSVVKKKSNLLHSRERVWKF